MHESADITRMLRRWSRGDEDGLKELLPFLYARLKQIARGRMRDERPDHTLGPTALVHEAFLRLVDAEHIDWQDRSHFLAVASRTMRRILVDYARRRHAQKRGGRTEDVRLTDELIPDETTGPVLELDDALERLGEEHARSSEVVELYYFGGLTLTEVGTVLGTSAATAMRDLRFAKAWLAREWADVAEVV